MSWECAGCKFWNPEEYGRCRNCNDARENTAKSTALFPKEPDKPETVSSGPGVRRPAKIHFYIVLSVFLFPPLALVLGIIFF